MSSDCKMDNNELGEAADKMGQYTSELIQISDDYAQTFAKIDEVKEFPHLPVDSETCEFQNYKRAREKYEEAYKSISEILLDILNMDLNEAWSDDKTDSSQYNIYLEAAERISMFHHVKDKVDLIIAAINHRDPEIQKIGLGEYDELPLESRTKDTNFPKSVRKAIASVKKIIEG